MLSAPPETAKSTGTSRQLSGGHARARAISTGWSKPAKEVSPKPSDVSTARARGVPLDAAGPPATGPSEISAPKGLCTVARGCRGERLPRGQHGQFREKPQRGFVGSVARRNAFSVVRRPSASRPSRSGCAATLGYPKNPFGEEVPTCSRPQALVSSSLLRRGQRRRVPVLACAAVLGTRIGRAHRGARPEQAEPCPPNRVIGKAFRPCLLGQPNRPNSNRQVGLSRQKRSDPHCRGKKLC